MPAILVDRAMGTKRIIGKNGGPRRRSGTRGRCPKNKHLVAVNAVEKAGTYL
jgi:hypothetical protein